MMTVEEGARMVSDPMEEIVAHALNDAGFDYVRDCGGENPSGLDFKLANGIEIEVKRFHSQRIAEQMSRAENVIAVQGKEAVEFFASLIVRAYLSQPPKTIGDD